MGMVTFGNIMNISSPFEGYSGNAISINATGEYGAGIGQLFIPGGGTKTISAAGGGRIALGIGPVTFATAPTDFRVGIEDVAVGLPDGTQDVFDTRLAGTHTVTANAMNLFTMTTGSKTMTHGDRIAITARMPVRAGSDSIGGVFISPLLGGNNLVAPYGASNGAKTVTCMWACIIFDDGTPGWLAGIGAQYPMGAVSTVVNLGTTPDEFIGAFQVPVKTNIQSISFLVDLVATIDDYELILYQDPFGTPTVIKTVSVEPDIHTTPQNTPNYVTMMLDSVVTLNVGTVYGVACRPTTANSISLYYLELGSVGIIPKAMHPFFLNLKHGVRTDQTGPFTEPATTRVPYFAIGVIGFDDGAGGGGSSPSSHAFVG